MGVNTYTIRFFRLYLKLPYNFYPNMLKFVFRHLYRPHYVSYIIETKILLKFYLMFKWTHVIDIKKYWKYR